LEARASSRLDENPQPLRRLGGLGMHGANSGSGSGSKCNHATTMFHGEPAVKFTVQQVSRRGPICILASRRITG
jgi:hypothetical protein